MYHNDKHGQMSFGTGQPIKDNKEKLKSYLSGLKFHPDVKEHSTIAKSFGVSGYKIIFREDAVRRFLKAIHSEPTTAATVEKITGIRHKYLCDLKRQLEKRKLLKVVYLDKCPTTYSDGVQFLTSNPDHFNLANQKKEIAK